MFLLFVLDIYIGRWDILPDFLGFVFFLLLCSKSRVRVKKKLTILMAAVSFMLYILHVVDVVDFKILTICEITTTIVFVLLISEFTRRFSHNNKSKQAEIVEKWITTFVLWLIFGYAVVIFISNLYVRLSIFLATAVITIAIERNLIKLIKSMK